MVLPSPKLFSAPWVTWNALRAGDIAGAHKVFGSVEGAIGARRQPLKLNAWVKLVKFWTSSRSDDLAGLCPSSIRSEQDHRRQGVCGTPNWPGCRPVSAHAPAAWSMMAIKKWVSAVHEASQASDQDIMHTSRMYFARQQPAGHTCLPSGRRVCNPWTHMEPFVWSRGAVGILEVTAQRRHFKFAVICNLDVDCPYLREDDHPSFPFRPPLSLEQEFQPSHLFASAVTHLF